MYINLHRFTSHSSSSNTDIAASPFSDTILYDHHIPVHILATNYNRHKDDEIDLTSDDTDV